HVAVLDGADAGADGAADRLGAVGVGADVPAPVARLLTRRLDLVEAELKAVQRVVWRGDAPGHHELDVGGPLPQLVTHGFSHLGHASDDPRQVVQAGAAGALGRALRAPPEVAVTAGLTHRHARDEKARPFHQTGVARRLHAKVPPGG